MDPTIVGNPYWVPITPSALILLGRRRRRRTKVRCLEERRWPLHWQRLDHRSRRSRCLCLLPCQLYQYRGSRLWLCRWPLRHRGDIGPAKVPLQRLLSKTHCHLLHHCIRPRRPSPVLPLSLCFSLCKKAVYKIKRKRNMLLGSLCVLVVGMCRTHRMFSLITEEAKSATCSR